MLQWLASNHWITPESQISKLEEKKNIQKFVSVLLVLALCRTIRMQASGFPDQQSHLNKIDSLYVKLEARLHWILLCRKPALKFITLDDELISCSTIALCHCLFGCTSALLLPKAWLYILSFTRLGHARMKEHEHSYFKAQPRSCQGWEHWAQASNETALHTLLFRMPSLSVAHAGGIDTEKDTPRSCITLGSFSFLHCLWASKVLCVNHRWLYNVLNYEWSWFLGWWFSVSGQKCTTYNVTPVLTCRLGITACLETSCAAFAHETLK